MFRHLAQLQSSFIIWSGLKLNHPTCPTIAVLLAFCNCSFVLDGIVFIGWMIVPACLSLSSLSSRMLSCWFLRSLPLPTAEYASCSLSPGALKASTVSGGRHWKEGTFTLKSPLELCLRAVKTGQQAKRLCPCDLKKRFFGQSIVDELLYIYINHELEISVWDRFIEMYPHE